jgi:hypothetical protein
MLAFALSLQLLGGPPVHVPELHLVPPLTLAGTAVPGVAEPDLAPRVPEPMPAPSRGGWYALSAGGILLGDAIAGTVLLVGFLAWWSDAMSGRSGDGEGFLVAGLATWLFLPPALGLAGARAAGAPSGSGALAYWAAFTIRLVGLVAMGAAADKDHGSLALASFVACDLVAAPIAIVRLLGRDAPAPGYVEPPHPSPAQRAIPPPR